MNKYLEKIAGLREDLTGIIRKEKKHEKKAGEMSELFHSTIRRLSNNHKTFDVAVKQVRSVGPQAAGNLEDHIAKLNAFKKANPWTVK